MKLMIASDIHGSAYYCRQLMEAYKKEQPDKLPVSYTHLTLPTNSRV